MRMYRSFIQLSTPFWTWPQASVVFTDLVRKIVCKSIAGLASWTIVSLYRGAHSGGPSPSRHKQGISLPSGEFSVWPHRRNWSIYVSFSFLSTSFCFSFSFTFTFTFTPTVLQLALSLTFLPLSFIHSLSLPLTGSGAKIQEKIWDEIGSGCMKTVTDPFRGWVLICFCQGFRDVCHLISWRGPCMLCSSFSSLWQNFPSLFFVLTSLTYFFIFLFFYSCSHMQVFFSFQLLASLLKSPYMAVPLFPASQGTSSALSCFRI